MTSNKIFSRSFLAHRLRTHWYLSLISTILFFLSGPFILLINYNQSKNYYNVQDTLITLQESLLETTNSFFVGSNIAFMYVFAYALATIIGLVLFSYLNNKKQVNFFHSQPLSRKKLFVSNYFASMILGLVPLFIMLIGAVVLSISTVGFGSYLSTVPMHLLGFVVFYATGLSFTALACQLTGSTIFALYAIGFLNFFLAAIYFITVNLISELSSTLYIATEFASYLSPVIYFLFEIIDYSSTFTIAQIGAFSVVAALVAVLSYRLYLARPSESSGKTIVYKPIGSFIKFISAYSFAVFLGFVIDTGGGFTVFIIIFGGFIFLTWLFMEITYRRSFKNMKVILPSSILATIIAVAGIHGLSAVAHKLDTTIPEPNQIKVMTFDFTNKYVDIYGLDYDPISVISDPELITESIDLLNKIVANSNNYYSDVNSLNNSNTTLNTTSNLTDLIVIYNNSSIKRTYRNIDTDVFMKEFSSIYDNSKYKESLIAPIEELTKNSTLSSVNLTTDVIDGYQIDYGYDYGYGYDSISADVVQDIKYIQPLIDASIKDIRESKFSELYVNDNRRYSLNLSYRSKENMVSKGVHLGMTVKNINVNNVISEMVADPQYSKYISANNLTEISKG